MPAPSTGSFGRVSCRTSCVIRTPRFRSWATRGSTGSTSSSCQPCAPRTGSGPLERALSVGLVGVRIEGDSLWISPPADGEPPTGLRLVVLRAVPGADGEYDALLAPEADQMFLYNYVPGTDFGRVTVRPGSRP